MPYPEKDNWLEKLQKLPKMPLKVMIFLQEFMNWAEEQIERANPSEITCPGCGQIVTSVEQFDAYDSGVSETKDPSKTECEIKVKCKGCGMRYYIEYDAVAKRTRPY